MTNAPDMISARAIARHEPLGRDWRMPAREENLVGWLPMSLTFLPLGEEEAQEMAVSLNLMLGLIQNVQIAQSNQTKVWQDHARAAIAYNTQHISQTAPAQGKALQMLTRRVYALLPRTEKETANIRENHYERQTLQTNLQSRETGKTQVEREIHTKEQIAGLEREIRQLLSRVAVKETQMHTAAGQGPRATTKLHSPVHLHQLIRQFAGGDITQHRLYHTIQEGHTAYLGAQPLSGHTLRQLFTTAHGASVQNTYLAPIQAGQRQSFVLPALSGAMGLFHSVRHRMDEQSGAKPAQEEVRPLSLRYTGGTGNSTPTQGGMPISSLPAPQAPKAMPPVQFPVQRETYSSNRSNPLIPAQEPMTRPASTGASQIHHQSVPNTGQAQMPSSAPALPTASTHDKNGFLTPAALLAPMNRSKAKDGRDAQSVSKNKNVTLHQQDNQFVLHSNTMATLTTSTEVVRTAKAIMQGDRPLMLRPLQPKTIGTKESKASAGRARLSGLRPLALRPLMAKAHREAMAQDGITAQRQTTAQQQPVRQEKIERKTANVPAERPAPTPNSRQLTESQQVALPLAKPAPMRIFTAPRALRMWFLQMASPQIRQAKKTELLRQAEASATPLRPIADYHPLALRPLTTKSTSNAPHYAASQANASVAAHQIQNGKTAPQSSALHTQTISNTTSSITQTAHSSIYAPRTFTAPTALRLLLLSRSANTPQVLSTKAAQAAPAFQPASGYHPMALRTLAERQQETPAAMEQGRSTATSPPMQITPAVTPAPRSFTAPVALRQLLLTRQASQSLIPSQAGQDSNSSAATFQSPAPYSPMALRTEQSQAQYAAFPMASPAISPITALHKTMTTHLHRTENAKQQSPLITGQTDQSHQGRRFPDEASIIPLTARPPMPVAPISLRHKPGRTAAQGEGASPAPPRPPAAPKDIIRKVERAVNTPPPKANLPSAPSAAPSAPTLTAGQIDNLAQMVVRRVQEEMKRERTRRGIL